MGQSTEELSNEIAGTRRSLATDLDALQDRVSPAAIVERRKQAARSRLSGIKETVMGSAHSARAGLSDTASTAGSSVAGAAQGAAGGAQERIQGSPLGAGLVAFGAGMVLAALLPASEKEARAGARLVETAQDQRGPIAERAKAAGQELADGVRGSATEAAAEVRESATEGAHRVRSDGQEAVSSVQSDVQQS